MLEKIVIANRGEIALRILRACRELGIKTVAVHSTADENLKHVLLADESVCIGPPPGKDSYRHRAAGASEVLVASGARWALMAELREAEEGDLAAAEDWRAKAVSAVGPPVWACDKCGTTHDAWGAVCGSCNAFDSRHWTTPKQRPQPFQLTDESAVPLLTNSAK